MEKVVYILGAGFSAPLGLPTMTNFISVSKDLFFSGREEFTYFKGVLEQIHEMSLVKNFYSADLLNVEEVLSIQAMRNEIGDTVPDDSVERYIRDVVKSKTPPNRPNIGAINLTLQRAMGSDQMWGHYGVFAANLLNLRAEGKRLSAGRATWNFERAASPSVRYAVVTPNYDAVLESACKFIQETYNADPPLSFKKTGPSAGAGLWEVPRLAKLHGDVDGGAIIAPSWQKTLTGEIKANWKTAHSLIAEADHIRIIGYSLPSTDTNIRYLLKSSVMDSRQHHQPLKTLDVICLDPSGDVKARYDEFIDFRDYRFKDARSERYLETLHNNTHSNDPEGAKAPGLRLDALEKSHKDMML